MTTPGLQGESQVYVFHLLVEVGFLPFYEHRFFELHLVFSSCRVQDLEAIQCSGCSARLWTLQMGSRKMPAGFTNITSITTCRRKFINHTGAKPLRDSIFYIKKILDFESSTLFFFNKNVVFPAQAEYSYSSADFRLKIF